MFKNRPNTLYKCDDKNIWDSRSAATATVIVAFHKKQIYVLCVKRSEYVEDEPNKWCLPGGYLDWDETAWQCCIREIYEETGLYIPHYSDNIIFDNEKEPFFIDTNPNKPKQAVVMFYYLILDFEYKSIPNLKEYNSEIRDIKWIPIYDINNGEYKWAFEHNLIIEKASEKFKNYLN